MNHKCLKKPNRTKVIIRLEKNNRYVEKRLTKRMVCALFDLQFMLDENNVWEVAKLNKIDKDLLNLFTIISFIDDNMHEDVQYIQRGKKMIKVRKKTKDYLFGKSKWKKIER